MRKIIGTVILIGVVTFVINTKVYVTAGEGISHQRIEAIAKENRERLKIGEYAEAEETKYLIDVTQEDINLMARVVMSEASTLCDDAQQAIATTIVNRVRSGKWGSTVEEVVFYPNAYSTQDNGVPYEECYDAVYSALTYEAFPLDMYYFREGKFHSFGYPLMKIGTTYFTTEGENDAWQD